jgi:hypothetical protein
MRFGFACPRGHEVIETFPIGEAPRDVACPDHGVSAARVFDVPYFTEDRRHMKRTVPTANAPTEDWSWTIGGPRPKSRSEARAVEKAMNIEFVSPAEARADAAKLRSGQNLDTPVKPEPGYLKREIAKRGIRFDRSLSPPRMLNREESERKLKAERPDWSPDGVKDLSAPKLPG